MTENEHRKAISPSPHIPFHIAKVKVLEALLSLSWFYLGITRYISLPYVKKLIVLLISLSWIGVSGTLGFAMYCNSYVNLLVFLQVYRS